jgi:hypothetical protein
MLNSDLTHINLNSLSVISLDIDRTLVHALEKYYVKKEWFTHFDHFDYEEYYVFIRPHLKTFLTFLFNDLKKNYNIKIGLFTAGSHEYALRIVDNLFVPLEIKPDFIFADVSISTKTTNYLVHTLSEFGEIVDKNNIIMIDDSVSIKKLNMKECYLINKFILCDDFQHNFFPECLEDKGLLNCIEFIKTKYNIKE